MIKDIKHDWDLTQIFKSNKELESFSDRLHKNAIEFEKTHKGKLDKSDFKVAISTYESIHEGIAKIMMYSYLVFSQDTTKGQFFSKYELKSTEIQNHILFFELEFCELKNAKKIADSTKGYEFYLNELLNAKKYNLSLSEEKIIHTLSPVGASAFSRLFDEHLAQKKFNFNNQKIGEEEMLSLLHKSDRNIRKSAQKSFTKGLKNSSHLLAYVLNMIRKDLFIIKNLRKYDKPESFRHISNCATQKSVDKLVESVNKNMNIVHEYYNIKAKLLGIKKLKDYDRYAPIPMKNTQVRSTLGVYEKDMDIVLACYQNFSPKFCDIAKKALKEGWVSSHPTENKRGGAFSYGGSSDTHPYVMLNYTNSRRDAFTIAHEFGHMIHQELSKKVSYLNMDTPLTTAETASVFGEMLLFDMLKDMAKNGEIDKAELIPMYAGKLEDIFSTCFRQIVMTNFERAIHDKQGELSVEEFSKIWQDENAKMFGDSVKLTKNYSLWWSYIPHFIHSPFYCYAYSYGQLLVLALFGIYKSAKNKKQRDDFIKTYTEFLSLGGSQSPKDLVAKFGLDIESSTFWQIGIKEIQKMLDEFKMILKEE